MNDLSRKFSATLDFVRAERIYFLILLFSLAILAFNQSPASLHEAIPSQAVGQLEKAAHAFDASAQDISMWIHLLETRPAVVLACAGLIVLFTGLFFGGLIILILVKLIPRFYDWFQSSAVKPVEKDWKPALFFRALTLIFSFIVASAVVIEFYLGNDASLENGVGLFHTLMIDLFACLAAFAVLKKEGLSWNALSGKSALSEGDEVKHGLAVYAAAFPVFISSLFLVLGVAAWLHYEPPVHPLVKIFLEEESRSALIFKFALIFATLVAPIFEEIYFRGFCYRLFRSWWGARAAMGISAAFFAGIHGSGFAFFPIFILGLALAWVYEKRGSLTACWTFHVLHNSLFTAYFFVIKALIGNS